MSQRWSEYARKERDLYETPAWVTDCVVPYINHKEIWEPACGSGKMAAALRHYGFLTIETDISGGVDFLACEKLPGEATAIVTNPPFELAQLFIEHALKLTKPVAGTVAMLLRADYDHAATRKHLFGHCSFFQYKVALTKRIVWFERTDGIKAAPSFNHAWYVWDWEHDDLPWLVYEP